MGMTADLTVVQKTVIVALHQDGKPQRVAAKEAGCSQSVVSKHINRKLSGRKGCTSNRDNSSLKSIMKQRPSKNLGEIHKEWTEAATVTYLVSSHS